MSARAKWGRDILGHGAKKISFKVGIIKGEQVAAASFTQHGGKRVNVLIWGAKNAIPFSTTQKQERFKFDYTGGWKKYHNAKMWKNMKNVCKPDRELKRRLPMVVKVCKMPNGDYWSLQKWQRLAPNMGKRPVGLQKLEELYASHFTKEFIPVLWFKASWSKWGKTGQNFDKVYGTYSCNGWPVGGAESTSVGVPQDDFGRNIYFDIVNKEWKKSGAYTKPGGWHTWNSFLAHRKSGVFCAGVFPTMKGYPSRPGCDKSTKFRATALGPGVTPIVRWEGPPPGFYQAGGFPKGYFSAPTNQPKSYTRGPFSDASAIPLNREQMAIAGSGDSCYQINGPV